MEVWWDEHLQTGQKWHQEIDNALLSACAVVALWSRKAIDSEWVQHEASIARLRGVLTHATIDGTKPPEIFRSIQWENLSQWDKTPNDQSFQKLLNGIRALVLRNKIARWLRLMRFALVISLISSLLIYGGYAWQVQLAGPQNPVVLWTATRDYFEADLNIGEIRNFYSAEDWDIAIVCHKSVDNNDIWQDRNAVFSFFPISNYEKKDFFRYNIKFHPDVGLLETTSWIKCSVGLVEKELGLAAHVPQLGDNRYQGLKWKEIAAKNHLTFEELTQMLANKERELHQVSVRVRDCRETDIST